MTNVFNYCRFWLPFTLVLYSVVHVLLWSDKYPSNLYKKKLLRVIPKMWLECTLKAAHFIVLRWWRKGNKNQTHWLSSPVFPWLVLHGTPGVFWLASQCIISHFIPCIFGSILVKTLLKFLDAMLLYVYSGHTTVLLEVIQFSESRLATWQYTNKKK